MTALLDALRAAVGAAQVLSAGDLTPYERDWRGRWRGKALAVVRPASTEEVQSVVRACVAHRTPLVAQGGNTGLVGGSVPDASGTQVLLSLARLDRIRDIDADNQTLTAEAGCVLQRVQQAADAAGLLFPLSLAAEGSCTIGGNLATNAGGTQVLRYGNARELCLGLEVVTASGEVWPGLCGLRKDNTGYDLRDLYIGSEGTLGVITAATLKLYPKPAAVMTALAACSSLPDCVALLALARARADAALTGFEVMNAASLALVRHHLPDVAQPLALAPWTVLVELSDSEGEAHARAGFESLLEAALERGVIADAALAESIAQANAMWHVRESIPPAQNREGQNIKHDVALPISRVAAFCDATDAALERTYPGARRIVFGHLGDGNLHYNLQAPEGADAHRFLAEHEADMNLLVHDIVAAHGGSISAEHGIGVLRRDELVRREPPVAIALMREIKRALDPFGLMNPGRVL